MYKDNRVRNWAFIGYPDSLPDDFIDKLSEYKVPWCMSPLHDKDINPDGEIKKAHYHFIMAFPNKKSYEQVLSITKSINCTVPEKIDSMVGYIRYLTHQDNPEKAQYNKSDIKSFCGFDITVYDSLNGGQIRARLKDIFNYIRIHDIRSYSDFIDVCINDNNDVWFDIATVKHTLPIKEYIKSYAFMHIATDPLTGEMLTNPDGTFIYVGYGVKK